MSVQAFPQTATTSSEARAVQPALLVPEPSALLEALRVLGPRVERAALLSARRAVFTFCERLRHGSLTLTDAEGTAAFGCTAVDLPVVRIRVHDLRFYAYAMLWGARGGGEAFALGLWDSDDPVGVVRLFARNVEALESFDQRLPRPWRMMIDRLRTQRAGVSKATTRRDVQAHYDLSNDFYALWLDETRSYSCALFERQDATLEEASLAKIDRILGKLELQPGDRLLEIGTGWGALALRAASQYGCHVVTTTLSDAQRSFTMQKAMALGLSDRVHVLGADYRELQGQYDKLVSVEMIEAVGPHGLGPYFRKATSLLKPGGRMALQAITLCERRYEAARRQEDYIKRYIFPGSCLPSLSALARASAEADLEADGSEDLSAHYPRTLASWRERFMNALPEIEALGLPQVFLRSWEWYLAYCEGGFREGHLGTHQLVYRRPLGAS
ncbi:MAG: class I SAM-dependent methyltransferase [Myxococcaceae bacterium]